MADRNVISGTIYVRVDGRQYEFQGDVECMDSSEVLEDVMGTAGTVGYKVAHNEAPKVKGTILFTPDLNPFVLFGIRNATVIAEDQHTGRRFTLRQAWWAGARNVNLTQGQIEAEFHGIEGRWKVAA